MEIHDNLLTLFSEEIEQEDGRYIIEIPANEVTKGDIQSGQVYRVGLLPSANSSSNRSPQTRSQKQSSQSSPVDVGEQRTVEIENIGDKGDGIARVERGYVIIVPDTEQGEKVTINITDTKENVAFGEVVNRHDYYE